MLLSDIFQLKSGLYFDADNGGGGGSAGDKGEDKNQDKQPPELEDGDPGDEDWKVEDLPPGAQKLIEKLRGENAEKRKKVKEFEKTQSEASKKRQQEEEQRLAQDQKWEELATTRAKTIDEWKPKVEAYERMAVTFQAALDKQLEALPEYVRTLAAKITDPVDLFEWLSENADKLVQRQAPGLDQGRKGDNNKSSVKLSPEQKEAARRAGISEEEYAKYL